MFSPQLLTLPAAARAVGVSEFLFRRMVKNGQVSSIVIGQRHRFQPEVIAALQTRGLAVPAGADTEPKQAA